MQRKTGAIVDATGAPISAVQVAVKRAGTAVNASLFSDNGVTTLANPMTNDANGTYEYFTPSGYYDETLTKTGATFPQSDSTDLLIWDPLDHLDWYAQWGFDALSLFVSGNALILDGGCHLTKGTAPVVLKTPTTTFKNGWLDVLGDATNAPSIFQSNSAGTIHRPFVIPSGSVAVDALILDFRAERVTATASTIRIGLGVANLTAAPSDGFYIEQIDSGNAFLKVRSGSSETGSVDLGVTLAAVKHIRIVAFATSIRAYVDRVAKTAVVTGIPTNQMLGFSVASTATGAGVGVSLDFAHVYSRR